MTTPKDLLKIGDFARLAGTNLRTLRYYEELGLLEPATRSSGGFRYYRPCDLHRVRLIQNLQHLGLHLEEIGGLLESGSPKTDRAGWIAKVDAALARQEGLIEQRIQELNEQRDQVRIARAKLGDCSPCEKTPLAENNFCETCQTTGQSLPALLSALFR